MRLSLIVVVDGSFSKEKTEKVTQWQMAKQQDLERLSAVSLVYLHSKSEDRQGGAT